MTGGWSIDQLSDIKRNGRLEYSDTGNVAVRPYACSSAQFEKPEVGCGSGELARELGQLGHEVVAIDSSLESVAAARRLGVDARLATFPQFEGAPFDCVLFTRSLHHLTPLFSAIERAAHLLNPSGLVLVEDFAFELVDVNIANFFYALFTLLNSCGKLASVEGTFARDLLDARGTFFAWDKGMHAVNSFGTMLDALRDRFDVLQVTSAPYLYRYIADAVPPSADGEAMVSHGLKLEKTAAASNERLLIGRRIVAKRK